MNTVIHDRAIYIMVSALIWKTNLLQHLNSAVNDWQPDRTVTTGKSSVIIGETSIAIWTCVNWWDTSDGDRRAHPLKKSDLPRYTSLTNFAIVNIRLRTRKQLKGGEVEPPFSNNWGKSFYFCQASEIVARKCSPIYLSKSYVLQF